MNEQQSTHASAARYSVGIDLGTTHCVLAFQDRQDQEGADLQVLPIPQLTAAGIIENLNQLPSFMYMAHEQELPENDIALPWNAKPNALVGAIARNLGSRTPIRLVASAKSWLCHPGVDRHSDFLPTLGPSEVAKISPVHATFEYLDHLRCAWDDAFPEHPLIEQDLTVTIPASFDPVARELSAESAAHVGFKHLTLLEEPTAAVYNWVHNNGDAWRKQVSVGDVILVADIGGGTTDMSLVAVSEEEGNLTLNRIAVGEHILLGGDNMDLALAYRVKTKLTEQGKTIETWQIQAITQACRDAKETLLSENDIQAVPITVPARGSKLLGATLRCELTRDEVNDILIEGFFPKVAVNEAPKQSQRSALTQRGLPYAQDPAVTRHLAAFLTRQQQAAEDIFNTSDASPGFIKPTALLLNGGVLKAGKISERLVSLLNHWLNDAGENDIRVLQGSDLDLAVAKGASYYGAVRQGQGVRIRGGLANAYYVGIESAMPAIPGMAPPLEALCIAPFGLEERSSTGASEAEFGLVVGEPVTFRFFGSSTRRHDSAGDSLEQWADDELYELPELHVTLPEEGRRAGEIVPVKLAASVTEIGTLKLEAIAANTKTGDTPQRWQVELDVRS
ncbi:MAG: hypothetical protein ACI9Y1_003087 [Lentisphaeria bacterium]